VIRPPRASDLDAIAELHFICQTTDVGEDHADPLPTIKSDLDGDWQRSGFDPKVDARVAEEDDAIVGYADVYVRPNGEARYHGFVRPDHRGCGVGTALHDALEPRTAGAHKLKAVVSGANPSAHTFFRAHGYRPTSRTWQMTIHLDSPPPAPSWPPGVTARTVERGRDEYALYELIENAFADQSAERIRLPYEEWAAYMLRADADLSLYFVAEHGDELIGAVLCPWYPDMGWIRQVAVRRDQRGRGLGLALLRHAFSALYERGHRSVGLAVDEWNETGAKRLYERAGMRVTLEHQWYERRTPVGQGVAAPSS
jgi:mycothiol synthase